MAVSSTTTVWGTATVSFTTAVSLTTTVWTTGAAGVAGVAHAMARTPSSAMVTQSNSLYFISPPRENWGLKLGRSITHAILPRQRLVRGVCVTIWAERMEHLDFSL